MRPSAILISVAAGLTSALLFAGLVLQSTSAVGLALAAPVPIAIASLGWGSTAGFISAAVAGCTIYALTQSIPSAVTLIVTMAGPMAIAGHLAGLSRPREDSETPSAMPHRNAANISSRAANDGPSSAAAPALDWYPLSRLLAWIAGMAIVACVFIGWLVGFDPQYYVGAIVEALRQGGGVETASEDELRALATVIVGLVPFIQPAVLAITLVIGLYVGAAITRLSGRLPRPKDDIPTAVGMPRAALLAFLVGLGAALLGGTLGLIGDVVVGGLTAAFTLVGLAVMHRRSRGRPGRGLVLFTAYAAIVFLSFPLALFAALGLFETYRGPRDPQALGRP